MKKIIFLLFLFLSVLLQGQDIRPIGVTNIPTPSWSFYGPEGSLYIYKGSTYGFTKILSANKVQEKVDSLVSLNYIMEKDSSTKYVTPFQLIQSLPTGFELEVITPGITQISLPFTLSARTLVWYNGAIISKNLWAGLGTQSITLFIATKEKDLLKIQNQ